MIFEVGIILIIMFASCACGACCGFLDLFRRLSRKKLRKTEGLEGTLESITSTISDELINETRDLHKTLYV